MWRVAFHTLGCKVNQYETEALAAELGRTGFFVVPWESKADFYVINGCAVTVQAAAKTRRLARQIKRERPDSGLVLLGCYSTAEPEQADVLADLVLSNREKAELATHLANLIQSGGFSALEDHPDHSEFAAYESCYDLNESSSRDHTRPLVKIQDGCNMYCSYCIIPSLRGPERSRPLDDVIREVKSHVDQGYKELVFTGIHLSRWGKEFLPQLSLADLIRELLSLPWFTPRIRLSSIEPTDVDDDLMALLAQRDSRLCPHMHIPLQSGCDATLRRMGRRYDTEEYRKLIGALRACVPEIAISTDLIVGFPQESDAEFAATLAFCQEMSFSRMHIFRYSSRPGTPAASMPHKVPKSLQEERSEIMHRLAAEMAAAYAEGFIGRSLRVLLEHRQEERGNAKGYSEYYLECEAPFEGTIPPQGLLCEVAVLAREGETLKGEIVARG